jgi:hypothetical protein
VALAAAGVITANVAAARSDTQIDLSADRRFTLSAESRSLARAVGAPLHVTALLNTGGAAARDARFLLSRYHEVNHRITSSVIDPDTHPGEARRLGVGRYATVVLTYRGRRVDAPDAEELEVSTGILRLLRGGTKTVCVVTGHGEPDLSDTSPDGLSQAASALGHNAFEPRRLDLTTGLSATVPSDCGAVLELGPRQPLLPREIDALSAYAKAAGRLLVVASPLSSADPNPLLAPWGVHFLGGLVLDPARSQGADQSDVVLEDLPSLNPVAQGVGRLEFPAGGGVVVDGRLRDGLTVSVLARTSARGYVAPHPDASVAFGPDSVPGPVVMAAAADDSRVEATGEQRVPGTSGPRIVRTRVVVTGADTWLTNGFLDHLGNRRLLLNAVSWLAQEEPLVAATSRPNLGRPLPLTPERRARILVVTVGLVPGAIVGLGLAVAFLRRRVAR